MEGLSAETLATLACGLGKDARVRLSASGLKVGLDTLLLAVIVDRLGILIWQNTKDGAKGRNRPKAFADALIERRGDDDITSFDTAEEFEEALKRFTNGAG